METPNENTQATPEATTPPSTGTNVDVDARVAELERRSEGLLRDLQDERRKRQELEQRMQPAPVSSTVQPDVAQDEVAKVLNPYIAPIKQQAEQAYKLQQQMLEKYQEDSAYAFLAEKTGKSRKQIENDTEFQQRLIKTAKKWGFVGTVDEVTKKAYEAMELEEFRTQQSEKARSAQAASQQSLPAGAPPAPVTQGKAYDLAEFNRMPPSEFKALSSKGDFKKVDDRIVYTPRS